MELVEATRDEAVRARDAAEGFAEQAVQANQAKSRFLAAASHDLRQPVHALGLFAAAARTHVQGDEGHSIMDKIAASIDSTEALLNALLVVSRLDAGIMLPDVQPFALDDLLRRLVDEYAPRAASKGLKLRWRPSGKTVSSDPALLERVLRNYLSNAIRYTATRPVRGGAVLVACRTRGAALPTVRVEVWDTGVGVAANKLDDIFQEFYQIGNPERNKANGLGPITAALITGDTAPDRLLEATHSGLPLLHKPLNALQLKTSLCKLLALAQQSSACRSDTFL